MLWMVISIKVTVSMKLVDGNLNSANYQTMLEENLIPSVKQNVEKIGFFSKITPRVIIPFQQKHGLLTKKSISSTPLKKSGPQSN